MIQFKSLVLLFAWGLLTPFPTAAGPVSPTPFEAEYALYSKGLEVAHIKREFKPLSDGTYVYHSKSHPVGVLALLRDDVITERSHWRRTESGFQPLKYYYEHAGSKEDRNVRINFDWSENIVRMQVNEEHWQMELEPGTLDKMLYQLAMMRDLKHGTNPIHYRVADGGKMKTYDFERLGNEDVETPYGDFQTMKVERHRDDTDRETILWCAEKLDYLPVKIINVEPDGLKTTALLKSYKALSVEQSTATVKDTQ